MVAKSDVNLDAKNDATQEVKYGTIIEEIFGVILVAKHDAKKEAKIGANLEEKIGTYLEVKHGAKWDAKVVEKMQDPILDANMVLMGMPFTKQKWKLSRKK